MKVAIVHDQLQEFGGAERVLVAFKKIFPEADVYTSFYSPDKLGIHKEKFSGWNIYTSWAQKIPFFNKLYSPLRFITPLIWEKFNFSAYDLVISSSGSYMSKGIITNGKTIHISYVHHPPRYLYNYETAIEWQKYLLIKIYGNIINHGLRIWDYTSSQRANYLIANSEETKKRIQKFYRRNSFVIYPPVDIPQEFNVKSLALKSEYYLTVSRLARAKHVDILIKAANQSKFNLKVIGNGRDLEYLKSIAGPTVKFLEHVDDSELPSLYRYAKAFLFSSVDEEFGIAPIEAMGFGLPVIAFSSGGLKETVKNGINGYLYETLHEHDLIQKIKKLESLSPDQYLKMRKNARKESEQYTYENFKKNILQFVDQHARIAGSRDHTKRA